MCILIWKPAEVEFSNNQLRDFHSHNPHGFGIMYSENGMLVTHKTVGRFKKIRKLYKKFARNRDCALHFRWATHGTRDLSNAHPHIVREGLALMHNGVLAVKDMPTNAKESDTVFFIRHALMPAIAEKADCWKDANFVEFLGNEIGTSNKFIMMDSTGAKVIVNERTGVWHQGAWYSNTYAWTNPYYTRSVYVAPKRYTLQHGAGTSAVGWETYDDTISPLDPWQNVDPWQNDDPRDDTAARHNLSDEEVDIYIDALAELENWISLNPHSKSFDWIISEIAANHASRTLPADELESLLYEDCYDLRDALLADNGKETVYAS